VPDTVEAHHVLQRHQLPARALHRIRTDETARQELGVDSGDIAQCIGERDLVQRRLRRIPREEHGTSGRAGGALHGFEQRRAFPEAEGAE